MLADDSESTPSSSEAVLNDVQELIDLDILTAENLAAACDYDSAVLRTFRQRFMGEQAHVTSLVAEDAARCETQRDVVMREAARERDELERRVSLLKAERAAVLDSIKEKARHRDVIDGPYTYEVSKKIRRGQPWQRSKKATRRHAPLLDRLKAIDIDLAECRRLMSRNTRRTKSAVAALQVPNAELTSRLVACKRHVELADQARVLAIQKRLDQR